MSELVKSLNEELIQETEEPTKESSTDLINRLLPSSTCEETILSYLDLNRDSYFTATELQTNIGKPLPVIQNALYRLTRKSRIVQRRIASNEFSQGLATYRFKHPEETLAVESNSAIKREELLEKLTTFFITQNLEDYFSVEELKVAISFSDKDLNSTFWKLFKDGQLERIKLKRGQRKQKVFCYRLPCHKNKKNIEDTIDTDPQNYSKIRLAALQYLCEHSKVTSIGHLYSQFKQQQFSTLQEGMKLKQEETKEQFRKNEEQIQQLQDTLHKLQTQQEILQRDLSIYTEVVQLIDEGKKLVDLEKLIEQHQTSLRDLTNLFQIINKNQ